MPNDIVFRRIHGRIVPIKRKKDNSLAKDVAGGVSGGAGVAAALYAGKKAHSYQVESAKIENALKSAKKFKGQLSLFDSPNIEKMLASSKHLHRKRNLALVAGALIGAPLIGYGLSRLNKKTNKKETDLEKIDKNKKNLTAGFSAALGIGTIEYGRRLIDPRINKNILSSLKKVFKYATNRKTFQYILKGI